MGLKIYFTGQRGPLSKTPFFATGTWNFGLWSYGGKASAGSGATGRDVGDVEKSKAWRWLVQRTWDSKPFFLTFAALYGVIPEFVGLGVMQLTNSTSRSTTPSFLRAVSAIRNASSPQESLSLYKITMLRNRDPGRSYPFDTHAAVFTIKSCSPLSDARLIRHLHAHLLKTSLHANVYVGTALLNGYVSSSFHDARVLYDEMPRRNIVTSNTMINGYVRCKDFAAARVLFEEMPERDTATWSAMIGGYMGNGKWAEGLEMFRELMRDGSKKPDQVTLVTVLSGCAITGSMALLGKSIHAYCERNGLEMTMPLGTSLIDMYAKNGCVRNAFLVFKNIPERNVTSWSAMICGLATHGHGEEAIVLFEEMKKSGVRPNEITFTGVLNACCHSGLLGEARKAFHSMTEEFGLKPSIHHYGCMVDLLGRAGMLEEAYEITRNMRIEPNIVVWTSLLAACKMHKNFEVANRVMEWILEMPIPNDSGGVYTLIADLYAMVGKWDDVERVRKLIDRRNVKKKRGLSLIEMEEQQLHEVPR